MAFHLDTDFAVYALSTAAAAVFRELGSPRRRAADITIGVTALLTHATLVTRNAADFSDIRGLAALDVG